MVGVYVYTVCLFSVRVSTCDGGFGFRAIILCSLCLILTGSQCPLTMSLSDDYRWKHF